MDLNGLEAYLAVSDLGSVTAAAKSLNRSQSSVSRLIQELERDLGYALFERSGPRLLPTSQGMLLLEDAERALGSIRQIRRRAEHIARGQQRPLSVGAISALGIGLLPKAWALCAGDLGCGLEVRTTLPGEVRHSVIDRQVDIGATSLPLDHRDMDIHWIGSASCVLAMPADDPLSAGKGRVRLSELAGRKFVGMAEDFRGLPARIRNVLRQQDVPVETVIQTSSSMNLLGFIRQGAGLSIMEPVTIAGVEMEGVVTRPLETAIPFYFGVITLASAPPNEAGQTFIRAIASAAASLLPDFKLLQPDQHEKLLLELDGLGE